MEGARAELGGVAKLVGGGWSEHLDGGGGQKQTRMAKVSWESNQRGSGSALVGSRIRIWWDGDRTFYEGNVVG